MSKVTNRQAGALVKKTPVLYLDQYGNKFWAGTLRELRDQIGMGGSRVSPMYVDKKDGRTMRVGYVIGQHWLTRFAPVETLERDAPAGRGEP